MEMFANQVRQLEGAVFDDGFGIDSALKDFFNAVQNAANDPSDIAIRQFVISNGKALADRVRGISQQQQDTLSALDSSAKRVNELAGLIGSVNARIAELKDSRDSGALNAMLDKRDVLLKELATLVTHSLSDVIAVSFGAPVEFAFCNVDRVKIAVPGADVAYSIVDW